MNDEATKKSALVAACLASFVTPFLGSAVNIALPAIGARFGMDAVMLSWVQTAMLLAAAVFLVPAGRLADIHGRKKTYALGMIILTVSAGLTAVSWSAWVLIFWRVLQGLGSAMIFATSMAILTSVFPPKERGRALGITVATVYLGLTIGPFVGGLMTQHLTWRSVFIFVALLGAAAVVVVLTKLKGEWAEAKGEKFDLAGSLIYGLALVALIQGISMLPRPASLVLIPAGLAGLVAFTWWESRIEQPVFQVRLFRENRVFALSSLAALIHYSATFALSFLLSLYLQKVKGLDPQQAGLVLVAQPCLMALLSPLAGRLSDRIQPRVVASSGMFLTGLGLALLTRIGQDTGLVYIVSCLVIVGAGFALFSSPNMNAIMSSVDRRYYGIASGAVGTMRLLGQMMSMGLATLVFAVFLGRVQITPELHPALIKSVKAALVIFSVLCGAGIFASLARGRLQVGGPAAPGEARPGGPPPEGGPK